MGKRGGRDPRATDTLRIYPRKAFEQQENCKVQRDYEALVDATRTITGERDLLRQRVAELDAANRRLVDMLWGRRSERRSESSDQQHLNFGDAPVDPPSAQEQEIITAQADADTSGPYRGAGTGLRPQARSACQGTSCKLRRASCGNQVTARPRSTSRRRPTVAAHRPHACLTRTLTL